MGTLEVSVECPAPATLSSLLERYREGEAKLRLSLDQQPGFPCCLGAVDKLLHLYGSWVSHHSVGEFLPEGGLLSETMGTAGAWHMTNKGYLKRG